MWATWPARWNVHSMRACSERGSHSRKALLPSTPNTFRSSSVGRDDDDKSWNEDNLTLRHGRGRWRSLRDREWGPHRVLTPRAQHTGVSIPYILSSEPPAGTVAPQ